MLARLEERAFGWLPKGAALCLFCFLVSRAWVLGVAYGVFLSSPSPAAPARYVEEVGPADRRPLNVLYYYDGVNYLRIARQGYSLRETPWYPLYPLAVRLFGGTVFSAVAVSNLAFLAGLVALERVGGRRAVAYACFSPISVVFSSAYSESLFFALAAWWMALSEERKDAAAGTLAGLAALARPPGAALAALSVVRWLRARTRGSFAGAAAAFAGAAAYPVWLWIRFGDPLAAAEANAALYHRHLAPPWTALGEIWGLFLGSTPDWVAPVVALNAAGLAWLAAGFLGPQPAGAALYALTVLSFPVVAGGPWPPASHGLLRYACAWPGSYAGISRAPGRALGLSFGAGSVFLSVLLAALLARKYFVV